MVIALQLYLEGLGFRAIERVGFAVGDRSEVTGNLLYQKIKNHSVVVYYTDYWKAYFCFLPTDNHHQSKKETFTVKSINGLIRHYLARFKRKAKYYSKSLDRIIYTLNLFFL